MTTATSVGPTVRAASPYRLSFPRVLRGEWIKLATLRSTWWSVVITAVLTIGIAMLIAQAMNEPSFSPIMAITAPLQFTMLLAGVLGAIAVTGEYSTGMIRSTLTAVPVRGSVVAAKALIVAAIMFAASLLMFAIASMAAAPIFAAKDLAIAWDDPSASWVPILQASLAAATFAVLGTAFGFLLRSGAGAIATTVGLLFVLPIVLSIFPMGDPSWEWVRNVMQFLPAQAAQSLLNPSPFFGLEGPAAVTTLLAWPVVGILAAWAVVRVRDA